MKIVGSKIWLLAVVLFAHSFMIAQENLSLANAIKVGLAQNFDIQLTQKNIEVNQIQNTWGQAGRFPTVRLNMQQGNGVSDQRNNPTSFLQTLLMSNSLQTGVGMDWVLFNGYRVKANKEKLEQLQFQSEGTAALVVENTIQAIMLTYYSAQLQLQKLTLLQTVMDLSREKWQHAKTKNDLGLGSKMDMLQLESSYLTDSSNVLMQELALKNTVSNLNVLMGAPVESEWTISDDFDLPENEYVFELMQQRMFDNNQNIKNELINQEILTRDISLAKATMYPVISFGAGANSDLSSFSIGGMRLGGSQLNYYANFTLNFTLYDGGKVRRGIKALEVQNEVNEIQMNQLKQKLSAELKTQVDLYSARRKMVTLSNRAFLLAKENFNMIKLRENVGLVNSFTLREIELAYLQTGISMLESSFNLLESHLNITRLTGGILEEMPN